MKQFGSIILILMALSITACTNADPRVYSLSELGRLKFVYRYYTASKDPSKIAKDGANVVDAYVKQFQVTTLDNGSAFITATILTDVGPSVVSEYMVDGDIVTGMSFIDNSNAVIYYTIDLTGTNPVLTIEADYDSDRTNNIPAIVQAFRIR